MNRRVFVMSVLCGDIQKILILISFVSRIITCTGSAVEKRDPRIYATREDPDQPAHSHSLVRIFAVRLHKRDLTDDIELIAKVYILVFSHYIIENMGICSLHRH